MAILDFLCFEAALLLGYWLWMTFRWHGNYQYFSDYSLILWILPPLGIFIFKAVGLYKPQMGVLGVQEQSLLFKGTWLTYLAVWAASFFFRSVEFSRLAILYSIFFSLFLLSSERWVVRRIYELLNERGVAVRPALIYGAGHQGQRLERWIRQSPQLGIQVVGFLDDHVERLVKKPVSPQILGKLSDLKRIAAGRNVSLFFIAHRNLSDAEVVEIFKLCQAEGLECWAIPSLYRFHVERTQLQSIGSIPLVSFREGFGWRFYGIFKAVLDFFLSIFLLVFTFPLWILIALGLRLCLGFPILFKQTRIGKNGKKIMVYKFRTLKKSRGQDQISPELAKETSGAFHPFIRFLRRSGFDELPQLINVLRGEMSLIGPRPEMPFIVEKYGPLERERLTVKPGITGLWQISKDRKKLLIHENMDYDLYYVEHFGFNLDLAIFVKTITTLLGRIVR